MFAVSSNEMQNKRNRKIQIKMELSATKCTNKRQFKDKIASSVRPDKDTEVKITLCIYYK